MRDYIVTQDGVSLHMGNVRQADAPQSPALALARKVNRISFTASGESSKNYTPDGYNSQAYRALKRIESLLKDYAAALRSLKCDLLISRSHCCKVCNRHVLQVGEAA
jgi:hypothetical protein